VQRGIVTPDRTTLITSTGRVYAISERGATDDGRADADALMRGCRSAAKRLIAMDMSKIAEASGSVISAAMFGALAGSEALPFDRAAFENTIESRGIGVAASQRAFAMAYAAARGEGESTEGGKAAPAAREPAPPAIGEAIARAFGGDAPPGECLEAVAEGYARVADFQDAAYADLYLQRLAPVAARDRRAGDGAMRLTRVVARQLALGMSFLDPIRVAELKLRGERAARIARQAGSGRARIVTVEEFLHPRLEEIAETVPAPFGRFIRRNAIARRIVTALTSSGRIVKTHSVLGFALLAAIAGLKPRRRASLRYEAEQQHLKSWLAEVTRAADADHDLALELAECLGLVRGYGATHARGMANFGAVLDFARKLAPGGGAAAKVRTLREAALADETGAALAVVLARQGMS
jgi:indolepyruvate ferredoxin oxidoreductase beta subunit